MKTIIAPETSKSKRFLPSKVHLAALLALSGAMPGFAHAQNIIYEWNGSSSSDATDTANWSLTSPSGSVVEAVINHVVPGQTPTWVLDGTNSGYNPLEVASGVQAEALTIGSGFGNVGELVVTRTAYDPTDPYTIPKAISINQVHIGTNGGKGTLVLDSNDSTYPIQDPSSHQVLNLGMMHLGGTPDLFAVGVGAGSEGRVNLLGSGKSFLEQQSYIDGSTLTVQAYGTSTLGDDTKIGADGGRGVIDVNGASLAFTNDASSLVLGSGLGAYGEINVLGGGKFTHNAAYAGSSGATGDALILGENGGHGVFTIEGNSATKNVYSRAVIGSGITVGRGAGSVGEIYINGGAQLQIGTSEYYDFNSGLTKFTEQKIGVDGGQGYVTINGQDSIWKVLGKTSSMGTGGVTEIGELYVGHSGVGEVTVSNGGTLSIGESDYGYMEIYLDPNDPTSGTVGNYHAEKSHTGGLGVLHLAYQAGSQGSVNIGAAAGKAAQGTGNLAIKEIQMGDGNASLVFNHTNTTGGYIFDTPLLSGNGHGVIRQIAGTTSIADQALSLYTGDLSVEGGMFLVNGTQTFDKGQVTGGVLAVNGQYTANQTDVLGGYFDVHGVANGPVEVKGAGSLTGDGKVGDVVINAGGTVAPGNSFGQNFGTLTVDSIVFNTGSIYQVNSNPDQTSDLLHATNASGGSGTATINGGTVSVMANADSWQQDVRYEILKADAGLTGQFSGVSSNLAFLEPTLEYDPQTAYLYLKRNQVTFPDVAITYNQKNAAYGAQTLGKGFPVYDAIVSMSAEQARISYENLSGEIHADVQEAVLQNSRYARGAVNQHLDNIEPGIEANKNLWIDTWGHRGHVKGDSNAARFSNNGWGVLIGADVFSNGLTTIGLAAGYEETTLHAQNLKNADADMKALHLIAYGRTTVGAVDLKGGLDYAYIDVDTKREIFVSSLAGQSKASYKINAIQLFGQASHTFEVSDKVDLTPYIGAVYQNAEMGSFTETGSLAALQHRSQNANQLSSIVGVKSVWKLTEKVKIDADLGWQHDFNNKVSNVDLNFIGGSQFNIRAPRTKADSAVIGLGINVKLKSNMNLKFGYSGELSDNSKNHSAKILFQYKF